MQLMPVLEKILLSIAFLLPEHSGALTLSFDLCMSLYVLPKIERFSLLLGSTPFAGTNKVC